MRALLATAILLTAAPAANAASFDRIYDDYKADGEISACNYTDAELREAAGQVPPDIDQYAPDFVDQLNRARERRASGACDPKPKPKEAPEAVAPPPAKKRTPPPTAAPVVEDPPAPAPVERTAIATKSPAVALPEETLASGGGDAPATVWLLAALAIAAVLGAVGGFLTWLFGWDLGRVTRPLGAAASEASGRGADLAGEFWDWLRLGR